MQAIHEDFVDSLIRRGIYISTTASVAHRAALTRWNGEDFVQFRKKIFAYLQNLLANTRPYMTQQAIEAMHTHLRHQLSEMWNHSLSEAKALDYLSILKALWAWFKHFLSHAVEYIKDPRNIRRVLHVTFKAYLAIIMISFGTVVQLVRGLYALLFIFKILLRNYITEFGVMMRRLKENIDRFSKQIAAFVEFMNNYQTSSSSSIASTYQMMMKLIAAGSTIAGIYGQVLHNYQSLYRHIFEDSYLFRSAIVEHLAGPSKSLWNR
eukprot:TRINITY_DN1543_c0_g1_i1.p1 TRINITY_DN1543_c0_g1~~TRINITY_DN1543_c0_g1_i1.p1  ORF type:complete len:265 (-),score=39.02 TRINITY_DN1543_c0_g1_i1:592-1386(-)